MKKLILFQIKLIGKKKIIDFDKKYELWANSNRNFHMN